MFASKIAIHSLEFIIALFVIFLFKFYTFEDDATISWLIDDLISFPPTLTFLFNVTIPT